MSTPPSSAADSVIIRSMSARSVTSAEMATTRRPVRAEICRAASVTSGLPRATAATSAPASASAVANARPRPRLAPVTTARRPVSSNRLSTPPFAGPFAGTPAGGNGWLARVVTSLMPLLCHLYLVTRPGAVGRRGAPPLPGPRKSGPLQAEEHGAQADEADGPAVELPHLAEHVRLLDALNDPAVFDPHVVEEVGLKGALGGRGAVEPAGRGATDRAVREGRVPGHRHLVQLHPQIREPLPDLADGNGGLAPVHESVRIADTVLAVARHIHELLRGREVLPVHRVEEAPVHVRGGTFL